MKDKLLVVLPVLVVITIVVIWRGTMGDDASQVGPAVVTGLAVFAAGIAAMVLKRRRHGRDRSRELDSVERVTADSAQARVFVDAIIAGTVLGCALVFWPLFPAPVAVLGLVALLVVDFYVRFALLTRRAGSRS